jgi:hypothetical protein
MMARVIVGIVAVAGVSTCGLIASLVRMQMMDQVNRQLPKGQQFGQLGWYFPKTIRLRRAYKKLYPTGNLLKKHDALGILGFTCLLAGAWSLGFFGR